MTPNAPAKEKGTVLLTGACGLIGSRLSRLLKDDYTLVGLDLKSPDDPSLPLHHVDVDLTNDDSVEEALAQVKTKYGRKIASVVHLAAYYDFTGESSSLYNELTVEGTRRLLQALNRNSFFVEQFVFSSSLLVMRPDEHGREVSELSATQAEWAYPQSKLDAEEMVRSEHNQIPYVILRIAGVYDEKCHSLPISQQIARIYEKQIESYFFPGDASHGQALIHLDDLAECFRRVIERRAKLGGQDLFLVAEPDVMSYQELQEEIGRLVHGKEWPTIRIPKPVAKVGAYLEEKMSADDDQPFIKPWMINLADDHYKADVSHACIRLGWQPQRRLRDTLPQMIQFLKQNPQAFYQVNQLPAPETRPTIT